MLDESLEEAFYKVTNTRKKLNNAEQKLHKIRQESNIESLKHKGLEQSLIQLLTEQSRKAVDSLNMCRAAEI